MGLKIQAQHPDFKAQQPVKKYQAFRMEHLILEIAQSPINCRQSKLMSSISVNGSVVPDPGAGDGL